MTSILATTVYIHSLKVSLATDKGI